MTAAIFHCVRPPAPRRRARLYKGSSFVKARSLLLVSLMLATTACGGGKVIEDGGVYTRRTSVPAGRDPRRNGRRHAVRPADRTDSAAIDVVATITNVALDLRPGDRPDRLGGDLRRRRHAPRRRRRAHGVLPYFDIAMQAGNQVVAKRVGQVAVNFAAGSQRGSGRGAATIRINRSSTGLPEDVRAKLTQKRKSGDVNAAIDPLSDPVVRAAVARATFEHLVGFQLTQAQLQYNATR